MADAVYLALGVTGDGQREVLGLWIAENEGARFWLSVMTELRNRGVQDMPVAVVDGLKGFPDAITAAFPETTVLPGLRAARQSGCEGRDNQDERAPPVADRREGVARP